MGYITRQEAAARLSIGVRTLDGLIARGQIPAYKVGGRLVRLNEKDIEDYMSGRLVEPEKTKKKQAETGAIQRVCLYVPGMKVC